MIILFPFNQIALPTNLPVTDLKPKSCVYAPVIRRNRKNFTTNKETGKEVALPKNLKKIGGIKILGKWYAPIEWAQI